AVTTPNGLFRCPSPRPLRRLIVLCGIASAAAVPEASAGQRLHAGRDPPPGHIERRGDPPPSADSLTVRAHASVRPSCPRGPSLHKLCPADGCRQEPSCASRSSTAPI